MRCQSVSSFHSPDCWSFQRRDVASVKFVTDAPDGVNLVSASFPRCPIKMTLLTLRDAILPCNVAYRGCEPSGHSRNAGGELLALLQQALTFAPGEESGNCSERIAQKTR